MNLLYKSISSLMSILLLVIPCEATQASPLRNIMEQSTILKVRFFDPFRPRRSLLPVGEIDRNFDIENIVKCNGRNCYRGLRRFPDVLNNATPTSSCSDRNYARLEFSTDEGTVGMAYVDITGLCISIAGRYYMASDNIILFLRNTPVVNW